MISELRSMAAEVALSAAISSGNLRAFKLYIDLCPRCLNAMEETLFKTTALIEVIQKAPPETRLEMASLILLHPHTRVNVEDSNGNTALVWAEWLEDREMVNLLQNHAGESSPTRIGR